MACETRLTENGVPPERNLRMVSLIYFRLKLTFTPIFVVLTVNHSKARLVVFASLKLLFLNFGHFAATNPHIYVAALVLYGTQGSIRGLNRWAYKWLPLSLKLNPRQHRWRENSYVFQVQ